MSIRPYLVLLLFALGVASSGCARWQRPLFDASRLRDPRAVDIDDRLSGPPLDWKQGSQE